MKEKLNKIQVKISIYLFAFVGIMIFLLWMFQIVFLQDFYKYFKTNDIKKSANVIAQSIDKESLTNTLSDLSQTNDMCINLIDTNGNMLYTPNKNCQLTSNEINYLYNEASNSDGTAFKVRKTQNLFDNEEQMSYIKIVNNNNREVVIVLNARITPVDATVYTLRSLLLVISLLLIGVAMAIAYIISKKVSKPIIEINEVAKQLATGDYEVKFDADGYEEIKNLSSTLNYAAKELNKVESLRKELIANMSHDLRTPLTMIAGYGEVMRDLPNENNKENIQIIIDETNRLTTMVNDMLDLSKLEAGVFELSLSEFSLTQLIKSTILRYEKLLNDNTYIICFEYDEDINIIADEGKILQVVYNLLNNAITYTGDDKTVIIKQIIKDNTVIIEVKDSGNGINEEEKEYIWERYYKATSNHVRANIGSGLGLSIVKSIISLHGGDCGVNSNDEKGSIFYFKLNID